MYLNPWLDPRYAKKTVKELAAAIRQWPEEFDSIAIRGVSGGLIGPALAMSLDKDIIVVRKAEVSHSTSPVEYRTPAPARYIIVDDLVETGATVAAIQAAVNKIIVSEPICVGVVLYAQGWRGLSQCEFAMPPLFKLEDNRLVQFGGVQARRETEIPF